MKKYLAALSAVLVLAVSFGGTLGLLNIHNYLNSKQEFAAAAAATPTGSICCFAVYGIDNPGQNGRLQADAQYWLDHQIGKCSVNEIYPEAGFNSDQLKGVYNCSRVYAYYAVHGPICAKVAQVAQVCLDSFGGNLNFQDSSCQTFKDVPAAQQYISSLQRHLKKGQTAIVTGNETYGHNPQAYTIASLIK